RLPGRHPLGRHPARCLGVAVHAADPGDLGGLHPARRAQAWEGNRMTTITATSVPRVRAARVQGSLQRSRRWALILSYIFLVIFAVFFLIPPYYMIVTSLKSNAEVAHLSSNPWLLSHGFTFEHFRTLIRDTDFLIYFKNTAIVTVCVVVITMV